LLKLITMLQTGKRFRSDDLASELRSSRRTIFRDLTLLKQVGIPVKYETSQRTYQIEQSFFLPPVNLTLPEALGLMTLVHKYAAGAGIPNYTAIVAAMMKIESNLPREIQEYCGSAVQKVSYRPAASTDPTQANGTFDRVWQAAYHHEKLDITYESFHEGRDIALAIRPYRLTFIARAWYVIAFSEMHNEVRTFKLDRFITAQAHNEVFEPDPDFDLARYFGNAWQMIRGEREYDIRIRFSPLVAGNVEEVIWHPTQQTQRLDDGSLMYEVRVDGLREIVWWILGYGKEAKVEEPAELRDLIARHILEMCHIYDLRCARPTAARE
jgi:proteasome accessory factor B